MENNNNSKKIAELNDNFRKNWSDGKVLMTRGVVYIKDKIRIELVKQVVHFDNFTEDNDPYGEHDFGAITIEGKKFFWKIDYYDNSMKSGSEDPSNPDITKRVLTMMLAEEY